MWHVIGSLNVAPPGATVSDSAPSSSTPFETAAGASGGKVCESRGIGAAGSGIVRSNGAASASANKSMGTNLRRPVSGEGVHVRSDIDAAGTLVMNSPASANAKRLSSSSQSALPPVENASLRDSRPKPVPKPDKVGSNGSANGTGGGREGARKSVSTSSSAGGGSGRRRREGHAAKGGGERRSSRTKSRSGVGSAGDQHRSSRGRPEQVR